MSGFDLTVWWAPALAFAAGVVSFASPCVLPLVPGYVSFVSAASGPGPEAGEARGGRPVVPIVLFVAGFAVVFSSLGAFAGTLVPLVRSEGGQRIAGVLVLLAGVGMIAYALRIGGASLYAERRPFLSKVKPGGAMAFPLGMAFAAGWTPCVGPVLAGILTLAGAQGGAVRGALLLFSYSLGLGVPFLLVGLGVGDLVKRLGALRRNFSLITGVSGALMSLVGILLLSGLWVRILGPLLRLVNRFEPRI